MGDKNPNKKMKKKKASEKITVEPTMTDEKVTTKKTVK